MNKLFALIITLGLAAVAQAQSLYFTYGAVTNETNVVLTLHGPTNATCTVESMNPYNQAWDAVGNVELDNYGYGNFSGPLRSGFYGIFRTMTTNSGTYYSTNAFGAVAGWLTAGRAMIGNPFDAKDISVILTSPPDFTTVRKWNNASNAYETATSFLGSWDKSLTVGTLEGVIVDTPSDTSQPFHFSGLFTTNALVTSIPAGSSIICSPLYAIQVPNYWTVDVLNTNKNGGDSLIPVQTPGSDPQCTINRMIDTLGNYQAYTLGTNNIWQTNGVGTLIPLRLVEGFWINKPTNATWTAYRSIW